MAFEDKTLTCVQCKSEFVFSAGEQQFYQERGLGSPPKRCKQCRRARKRVSKADGGGEYRSPAFENSAPVHQRIRGRGHGRGPNPGGPGRQGRRDYRSPSFGDKVIDAQSEYRAPGFKEYADLDPADEYRAPGFKEYDNIKPEEEYRAPGFSEDRDAWKDERPMFSLVCSVCGAKSLVPFLPEEKESPMCQECYKRHLEERAADQNSTSNDA